MLMFVDLLLEKPMLVKINFTLHEHYSFSISKVHKLLLVQ